MPILTYSVLRLGLFGACLGVLYWVGLGGWLLVVVAAFAAWGVSYVVLAGPRDAAAVVLAEQAARRADGRRFSAAVEADAAHEDAVLDAADRAEAAEQAAEQAVDQSAEQPNGQQTDRAVEHPLDGRA